MKSKMNSERRTKRNESKFRSHAHTSQLAHIVVCPALLEHVQRDEGIFRCHWTAVRVRPAAATTTHRLRRLRSAALFALLPACARRARSDRLVTVTLPENFTETNVLPQ